MAGHFETIFLDMRLRREVSFASKFGAGSQVGATFAQKPEITGPFIFNFASES